MTKKQRDKIIASIEKDAELNGQNFDPEQPGKYCVIGGFIASCGLKPEIVLKDARFNSIHHEIVKNYVDNLLVPTFGLTHSELGECQRINNLYDNTTERRKELITYINSISLDTTP